MFLSRRSVYVLSKIFGPKRGEVRGEWRKLHNEELNMYSSPNITPFIKEMCGAWHVWGEKRCLQGFSGKPEGKRPLGRPWSIWEVNIKMNQVVG